MQINNQFKVEGKKISSCISEITLEVAEKQKSVHVSVEWKSLIDYLNCYCDDILGPLALQTTASYS
jgi:hypothetical protein